MLNLNYNINQALGGKVTRNPAAIPYQDFFTEILSVAGGGRGGEDIGGGGGAGGYKYQSGYYVSSSGIYTVVVGAGQPSFNQTGICGADPGAGFSISGSNSFVYSSIDGSNFYTMGGGAAGCGSVLGSPLPASDGGSGGGGQQFGGGGGNGYTDADGYTQGKSGATAIDANGGGGGGHFTTGGLASPAGNSAIPGSGSLDLLPPDFVTARAGGGIGAVTNGTLSGSFGGGGGSGNTALAITASNGQPNTGGGGGGLKGLFSSGSYNGSAGGSGIVQFRYPGPQRAYGGQVYEYLNPFNEVIYTVHSFTASGIFQPIQ
jgi:hypothetical protein